MHHQKGYSLVTALMAIILLSGTTLAGWLVFNGQTSDAPTNPDNSITSFDECEAAGYPIAESYPAQCIGPDDQTFVQQVEDSNGVLEQAVKEDAQIKNSAGKLLTESQNYAGNNSGLYPTLGDLQANSELYQFPDAAFVARTPVKGEIQYQKNAQCSDQNIQEADSSRSIAVRVLLSDGSFYCIDNQ